MQSLRLTGGPVRIEGAVGVRIGDGYVRPWRLPPDELDLFDPALAFVAATPAGVRVRFATDATAIALEADQLFPGGVDLPGVPAYDLVIDNDLVASAPAPGATASVVFEGLPPGTKVVEIWLPVFPGVRLRGLSVEDGASVDDAPDGRPRWVTYGSSITHCLESASPARTWPGVAARRLDWHLTCLGYAGMCHLDPLVARMIGRLPTDRITLKLGINVHNMATLRERTFAPAVHGFLATIRDANPEVPITVISPIFSPEREESGWTVVVTPAGEEAIHGDLPLRRMREILAGVVEARRRHGDLALDYLDGTQLFGADDAADLPDGLHPNAQGYERIGERAVAFLSGVVPGTAGA